MSYFKSKKAKKKAAIKEDIDSDRIDEREIISRYLFRVVFIDGSSTSIEKKASYKGLAYKRVKDQLRIDMKLRDIRSIDLIKINGLDTNLTGHENQNEKK